MHNLKTDSLLGQELDGYLIEEVLGRGGLACVYRGLDIRMRRHTAIKVLFSPEYDLDSYTKRFEVEARAIAQLKHPNIVGIYRFNNIDDLYYIAMEYIDGADLQWILRNYRESKSLLDYKTLLTMVEQIADALDYAHANGIIHRDVKPGNIMINRQGDAILTDFNLARIVTEDTAGEAFGTPHYISPEQAISSADVVPQSDFYSFGIILYELLVGDIPFKGSSLVEIISAHVNDPVPDPCITNPNLHPAIGVVLKKVLAKDPNDRYPTGKALFEALRDAINQSEKEGAPTRPIAAESPRTLITRSLAPITDPPLIGSRPSRLYRSLSRFVRFHPVPTFIIAVLAVAVLWLILLPNPVGTDDDTTVRSEVARADVRFQGGKELRLPAEDTMAGANVDMNYISWSPDGQLIAGAAVDGSIIIWNAEDREIIRRWGAHNGAAKTLAWNPDDGNTLISGGADNMLMVWNIDQGGEPVQSLAAHSTPIAAVAWSPDGSQVVSGDVSGRMIRWRAGEEWQQIDAQFTSPLRALDWSSDGLRFVSGSEDYSVRIWDAATGTNEVAGQHRAPIRDIHWGDSAQRFVVASDDGDVRLWRLEQDDYIRLAWATEQPVAVRLNHEESLIAAAYDSEIRIWDTATFERVAILDTGNNQTIRSIDWDSDGTQLLAVTETGSARLWSIPDTIPVRLIAGETLDGGDEPVSQVAWDHSGSRMATIADENTLVVWDVTSNERLFELDDISSADLAALAWSPDGAIIAIGDCKGVISLVDVAGQQVSQHLTGHQGCIGGMAVSPDGQLLWSADSSGSLRIWDIETFELVQTRENLHTQAITGLIALDSTRFATLSAEGNVRIWQYNSEQVQPLVTLSILNSRITSIAWNPVEGILLGNDAAGRIRLWDDPFNSNMSVEFSQGGAAFRSLAINQTGEYLAAVDEGQCLTLWSTTTAERLFHQCDSFALGHTALAWNPEDAEVLVTGTEQGEIILWRVP